MFRRMPLLPAALLLMLLTGCSQGRPVTFFDGSGETPSLEFRGEYTGCGVWVEYDGVVYAAVPAHAALEGFSGDAAIEYRGDKLAITGVLASRNRDLALLKVDKPPYRAEVTAVSGEGGIARIAAEEFPHCRSGTRCLVDGRPAFFIGMTMDKNTGWEEYFVFLDRIAPGEMQIVDPELLTDEAAILRSWRRRNLLVGAESDARRRIDLWRRTTVAAAEDLTSCLYMTKRFAEEQRENAAYRGM